MKKRTLPKSDLYPKGLKVILFQPQIPQNTGNIARTCAVTGAKLILVEPLGFNLSDRWMKRAGLDYWDSVYLNTIDALDPFLEKSVSNFYFFSSKAKKIYSEISYQSDDMLIFGSETEGLPQKYFDRWPEKCVTLPMLPSSRCLNLATSVGIALYEAWRQLGFIPMFQNQG